MGCAQGALSRFYVKDDSGQVNWTTPTVKTYEFLAETLGKRGTIVHPNGIRGTRSRASERVRLGPYRVMGTVLMNIDPLMLDDWLPRMLGKAEVTNVFDLDNSLSPFSVMFDRVTGKFDYSDCYVNRWLLRGQANQFGGEPQPLQLALELIGKRARSPVSGPVTGPSGVDLSTASNTSPYIYEDSVLTLNSVQRPVIAYEFSGNNYLQVRFTNSLYATDICPQDREIGLKMTLPYTSDTEALLDLTIAGVTGSLVLTNSTISKAMTCTLGNVQIPTDDPNVRGKQEILLELQAQIYSISTTPELSVQSTS